MKPLNKFSKEFFDKYKEKPVRLYEYNFEIQSLADKYVDLLKNILGQDVKVGIIGSVAYKIPATDIEIAIYGTNENIDSILKVLEDNFNKPVQSEKEFFRFEIKNEEYELDIHVYLGYESEVSEKLTRFMLNNPNLIDEYKAIKEKYSYSRREYQYQKNIFLNNVIENIPEN
jgi:hypothetical protein